MISSYCSLVFLQSYTESLASGRLSVPSGLRAHAGTQHQCLHRRPCGCLALWGRWQVQQVPVMVNTSLPPKSQRSDLEMKTFWGVQSRFAPRVRARSCLLTEARQISSLPHDKSVLSCVRWNSSTQPKRKDMISDFPISAVKSFCLQKTICEDFLGLQSSNQQSIPHQALPSFSSDVCVTLGMSNCYIRSIRF